MSGVRFAGYASIFDRADTSGDVVRRGAFAGAGRVPLLWQHDPKRPVGVVERLEEDARGLRVIGRLSGGSAAAREAGALLRDGTLDGLSFGYRVRRTGRRSPGGRELLNLDLLEISLVTFPMQPLARVHAVSVVD